MTKPFTRRGSLETKSLVKLQAKWRGNRIRGANRFFENDLSTEIERFLKLLPKTPLILHRKRLEPRPCMLRVDESPTGNKILTVRLLGPWYRFGFSTTRSFDLTECNAVVKGRCTTNFLRTEKYITEDEVVLERINDRCFSLCDSDTKSSIADFEVPIKAGGWSKQIFLTKGFAQYLECDLLESSQANLNPVPPSGIIQTTYTFIYSKQVSAIIVLCILITTVTLAIESPLWACVEALNEQRQKELAVLGVIEWIVSIVFTLEVLLKVIALEGLFPYLKDGWNCLDLFVVGTGWIIEIIMLTQNGGTAVDLSALRALRAFRVLRTMKHLSGVREIADTFSKTTPLVCRGLVVFFYFLLLYAEVGIGYFGDVLNHRCAIKTYHGNDTEIRYVYPNTFCDADEDCADLGAVCEWNEGLNGGFTSFHEYSVSIFTVYKYVNRFGIAFSFQGMRRLSTAFAIIYLVSIVVFVTCLVSSLFIAIVRGSFAKVRQETIKRKQIKLSKVNPQFNKSEKDEDLQMEEEDSDTKTGNGGCCYRIITSKWFDPLVTLAIVLNTIFLGLGFHGQSDSRTRMLEISELFFTVFFAVEVVLRVIGLRGFRNYLIKDKNSSWNRFDFCIVLASLIDLILMVVGGENIINLSLLRCIRILRVVRVLRRSPDLSRIINGMLRSFPALINLGVFWILLIGVFAILGMQLFGCKIISPRANFYTFPESILTLFKCMTGGALWPIFHLSLGVPSMHNIIAYIFFISFTVFSVTISLNFMIVIVMSNFALSQEKIQELRLQKAAALRKIFQKKKPTGTMGGKFSFAVVITSHLALKPKFADAVSVIEKYYGSDNIEEKDVDDKSWFLTVKERLVTRGYISYERFDYSFLLIPPESRLRSALHKLLSCWWFEATIIFCIAFSSILLAMDSPLRRSEPDFYGSTLDKVFIYSDIVFLIVFTIEFLAKTIAYGVILPKESYLGDPWNRLDFFVLLVTYIGLSGDNGGLGRIFRIGRVLRPLRMINRNEGLKVIVDSLLRALRPVSYAFFLLFCLFFMFGIVGQEMFSGMFWRCNDNSISLRYECTGHYYDTDGILKARVWYSPPYGFDSIVKSIATLYEVVSLKGWPEKLHTSFDAKGVDIQPKLNESQNKFFVAVFYMTIIILGNFFMMKLFVGIIVGSFRQFSGKALLTPGQLQYVEMQGFAQYLKPEEKVDETMKRKKWSRWLLEETIFTKAVFILTFAYVILISTRVLSPLGYQCIYWTLGVIYVIEVVLNFLAYGKGYLTISIWNVYEVIITVCCILLSNTRLYLVIPFLKAMNFRKLITMWEGFKFIHDLILILNMSLLQMGNVTLVLFIFLFVYAVLGMQLFAGVKQGAMIGSVSSFDTFPEALLTLFQIFSGDNWIHMMRDCAVVAPYCKPDADCGDPMIAHLYFYFYYLCIFGIFGNLYVATIVDTYASKAAAANVKWVFSKSQLMLYKEKWEQVDSCSTGRISFQSTRKLFLLICPGLAPHPNVHVDEYMEALIELSFFTKLNYPCTLPSGKLSLKGEKSLGINSVLDVLIKLSTPIENLPDKEKFERERLKKVIKHSLAMTKIQSVARGYIVRKSNRLEIDIPKSAESGESDQ